MQDLILFLIVYIIGYICFVVMVLVLGKPFFSLFTKGELAENGCLALSK